MKLGFLSSFLGEGQIFMEEEGEEKFLFIDELVDEVYIEKYITCMCVCVEKKEGGREP